jgi:eukaryotic-like serine/threonine-protein kinase
MNPKHWTDEELFARAKDLGSVEERARLLAEACAGDAAQRRRIEGLLGIEQEALGFFEAAVAERDGLDAAAPPAGALGPGSPLEGVGDRVGPFRLLKLIGEGGFARVFLAEQSEPVRREVALKILKPGMDTGEVLARFELERQALAMMNHTNLAKLFAAGATAYGRPYFAMEFVAGEPLTRFCEEHRLTLRERLELFISVCRAVQHAHQKGILHRDLKPANILASLVDGRPVAKVIDFGIAKALHGSLTSKTLFTRVGQFIGTPAYVSPEQVGLEGHDVDTRADIYSLGCVLYELLSGRPPFAPERLCSASASDTEGIICEEDPPRPSNVAGDLRTGGDSPASRGVDPARLKRQLRGELDWIVMKAIEKDPNRRYDSASALADDVERYLHDEPVQARPPEWSYRMRKFVRRHRVAVAAGITVVISLALGLQLAVAGLEQASKERDKAVTAEGQAKGERDAATAERLRAEAYLYAADMNLASYALRDSNVGRARELLRRHIPKAGEPERRGWEWRYLWRQCQSDELATVGGHDKTVTRVAFSPDGKLLASAGLDKKLKLWDVETRKNLLTLDHDTGVTGVAFSPDGKRLATCQEGEPGKVRLWNTETWKVDLVLTNKGDLKEAIFSPDGKTLAATGTYSVNLWDLQTGEPIAQKYTWHSGLRLGFDFSPDGKWLAYQDRNEQRIMVWDIQARTNRIELAAGVNMCTALKFSPSGQYVVAGIQQTNHEVLIVWDIAACKRQLEAANAPLPLIATDYLTFSNHAAEINAICFSPDGKLMMTGSADQKIKIWDTDTWREVLTLKGHDKGVWGLALSPSGHLLASGSSDNTVRLWSTEPSNAEADYRTYPPGGGGPPYMIFASLRAVPCWNQADGSFQVWDPLTGQAGPPSRLADTNAFVFTVSADRRLAAMALPLFVRSSEPPKMSAEPPEVSIWDTENQKTVAHLKGIVTNFWWGYVRLGDALAAFSPDNRYLAACYWAISDDEAWIRCWKTRENTGPVNLRKRGDQITSWSFSTDSTRILTAHKSGAVCLWEAGTGKLLASLTELSEPVYDAALSPDGRTLATTSSGKVQVWDLERRARLAELTGALLGFRLVAFSPDGSRLAACSGERDIKVWEMSHYQEVATLRGHKECHERLGFTSDGDVLISMGYEGVHLWRAPSLVNQ